MIPEKTKQSNDPAIPHLDIYSKEVKARLEQIFVYTHIHSSIIHNSQELKTTQVSTDGWMNKQNIVYTYNGILFSLKNKKVSDIH